jgi:pimeloyl-ACP methyl ester carboxylesterase
MTRARTADAEGVIEHQGVKIHYEIYGDRGPTILLMPTWTIVHKRSWKMQVPYLARHFRVVTYDGPGNGASDRPTDPAAYGQAAQMAYTLAVLDATGTERAVVVALSRAANWALELAADHPHRVHGTFLIAPSVMLTDRPRSGRVRSVWAADPPDLAPSRVPRLGTDPDSDWAKYNRAYLHEHWDDFLWFFFGQCFSERHSTKAIDDAVSWGRETTPEVLAADVTSGRPDQAAIEDWCARITSPLVTIHGDDDHVVPLRVSELVAERTGGELVTLAGSGHLPMARDPIPVNVLIRDFAERFRPTAPAPRTWHRAGHRPRRVLFVSSPIGLGHGRRDLAIARALRERRSDVEISWLTQHPVTTMLELAGERVHPASAALANESAHIENEAAEHDLHCFEALRRMDEIMVNNFMVFHDLVRTEPFDLVVGDEAWDIDHFLHENPELKRTTYAWLTDFVGYLPTPDGGTREALVAADYNAEMIGHIERWPRLRDRAIFVGDPDDIVPDRFGPDLPGIREWTEAHYDFAGYVTGFEPGRYADREALRAELGYRPGERVCVVTVGGSGVGTGLLARVGAAYEEAARRVAGLRMIVVTGPRIAPDSVRLPDGVEVHAYVDGLHRHLAACDLAVVQGGLTTCMELTATGRPFIYVPLRRHFEQQFHVAHRLRRHAAGRRLDYDELTPDGLGDAIATEIGREVTYRPVPSDGAAKAAALLADLI